MAVTGRTFADDAWLAGFADGEGCFVINKQSEGGFNPVFSLLLRADDAAILRELQGEFGGRLHIHDHPDSSRPGSRPGCVWRVTAKRDLAGLVHYFDRFPLRAKKARDYGLWREAVSAYCRQGRRAPELPSLNDAIRAGRAYGGPIPDVAPPDDPRLRLVVGGEG